MATAAKAKAKGKAAAKAPAATPGAAKAKAKTSAKAAAKAPAAKAASAPAAKSKAKAKAKPKAAPKAAAEATPTPEEGEKKDAEKEEDKEKKEEDKEKKEEDEPEKKVKKEKPPPKEPTPEEAKAMNDAFEEETVQWVTGAKLRCISPGGTEFVEWFPGPPEKIEPLGKTLPYDEVVSIIERWQNWCRVADGWMRLSHPKTREKYFDLECTAEEAAAADDAFLRKATETPVSDRQPWAAQLRTLDWDLSPSSSATCRAETNYRRGALQRMKLEDVRPVTEVRQTDVSFEPEIAFSELSEPESQDSAESISGDVARAWEPQVRDPRYVYGRDKAAKFATTWRPLRWSFKDWATHLVTTGAKYDPEEEEEQASPPKQPAPTAPARAGARTPPQQQRSKQRVPDAKRDAVVGIVQRAVGSTSKPFSAVQPNFTPDIIVSPRQASTAEVMLRRIKAQHGQDAKVRWENGVPLFDGPKAAGGDSAEPPADPMALRRRAVRQAMDNKSTREFDKVAFVGAPGEQPPPPPRAPQARGASGQAPSPSPSPRGVAPARGRGEARAEPTSPTEPERDPSPPRTPDFGSLPGGRPGAAWL
eukprot:TRINITY_DN3253_c0_g1_i1.p1 TRINITY_DN3253_c0_g1~~TRINITY_DN3253_c0_g1_i1.p1  ORF type:complete len:589 (-),score=178.32 TRINITY_DN3253_c0_g1_i1:39-1805(-)